MKNTVRILHPLAGVLAFLIILSFFTSSLVVELIGDHSAITTVKSWIAYGIWLLIPLMVITGITGQKMAPSACEGVIGNKKKRMPFIAANGLIVLVPAALYLQHMASEGRFDTLFYSIQAVELVAGFINLTLMSLNIRDGVRVARRRQPLSRG